MDSVQAVSMAADLEDWLGRELPATLVYDYPTIEGLARHLSEETANTQATSSQLNAKTLDMLGIVPLESPTSGGVGSGVKLSSSHRSVGGYCTDDHAISTNAIAIIGLGCRFPGANNPDEFWQLLHDGIDAISEVPANRWDLQKFYNPDRGI